MKRLLNKIKAAEKARISFDGKCDNVLKELLKHFDDYDPDTSDRVYYIEHQDSDGIVLADNYATVYHLGEIIDHITKHRSISSKHLNKFRI